MKNSTMCPMGWATASSSPIVDYTSVIAAKMAENPYMQVHIGTDSQFNRNTIHFVSIVAFRNKFLLNGATFIQNNLKERCKITVAKKLWDEVTMTMDIVTKLIEYGIPPSKMVIEFDLNPNPLVKNKSNVQVASAVGWASGYGVDKILLKNCEINITEHEIYFSEISSGITKDDLSKPDFNWVKDLGFTVRFNREISPQIAVKAANDLC